MSSALMFLSLNRAQYASRVKQPEADDLARQRQIRLERQFVAETARALAQELNVLRASRRPVHVRGGIPLTARGAGRPLSRAEVAAFSRTLTSNDITTWLQARA